MMPHHGHRQHPSRAPFGPPPKRSSRAVARHAPSWLCGLSVQSACSICCLQGCADVLMYAGVCQGATVQDDDGPLAAAIARAVGAATASCSADHQAPIAEAAAQLLLPFHRPPEEAPAEVKVRLQSPAWWPAFKRGFASPPAGLLRPRSFFCALVMLTHARLLPRARACSTHDTV